jgi:hypothetical protein
MDSSLVTKILAALATRFDTTIAVMRPYVSIDHIEQFGKLRHLGGDTMVASALAKVQSDSRDATFIRVRSICCSPVTCPHFFIV